MKIAVDAAFLKDTYFHTFLKLAESHQEDYFIFIFDEQKKINISFPKNVKSLIIPRNAESIVNLKLCYNLKIPIALKKYKADIFVTENLISILTKVPQLLLSPDLTFIFQPSFLNKKWIRFYKRNAPRFLNNPSGIIVNSDFHKKEIISQFKLNEEKIKVLYPQIKKEFIELNFEEREIFKEKYAEGNEYFLYDGTISPRQNLLNVLKAFSFLKKRQKSKMQFIILGNRGDKYEEFVESLRLFRFKEEVKILENIPRSETVKIVGSAYAMLYLPNYVTDLNESLEPMKNGIPAIVSSTGLMRELYADAALYAEPENYKDISEKMMLIFKDEKIRKDLIEKEKVQIKRFSEKNNEEILYQMIKKLIKKNLLK